MSTNKEINDKLMSYKLCFSAYGLLLVWVGVIFLIITPALSHLKQKSNLLKIKVIDEKEKERKIKQFPILKKQFQEFSEDRNRLVGVLFDKNDIVKLVRELEEIALETGNNIDIQVENGNEKDKKKKEITSKKKKKEDEKEKLLVGITDEDYFVVNIILRGDYNSFLKFIYKLENIPYYNNVINFELVRQEAEEKNENISRYQGKSMFFAANDNIGEVDNSLTEKDFSLVSKIKAVFYLRNRVNKKK